MIDGRGCAVAKGIALSQETVLSRAKAPYPVEDTRPQSSSVKNQTAAWIEVNRDSMEGRDEDKESSLDAGSGVVGFCPHGPGQDSSQPTQSLRQADTSPSSALRNVKAYIDLLRSDVRQQKSQMAGEVKQLSAADAEKFWPIYHEYDAQLDNLNDLRVANIQEYANSYDQMTDEKADELIPKTLAYRKQRSQLLATYYERVKEELGGITAAVSFRSKANCL